MEPPEAMLGKEGSEPLSLADEFSLLITFGSSSNPYSNRIMKSSGQENRKLCVEHLTPPPVNELCDPKRILPGPLFLLL